MFCPPWLVLGYGQPAPIFSPCRFLPVLCHPAPFLPRVFPGFANFLRFSAPAREVSGFVWIKKTKRFSLPAAAPRNRSRCRDKKFPFMQKKPLCIVHNGFFLYPSPNAFSYSSMRRFSSAQYRASSSDMSSRLRFCAICSPSLLPPARSVVIRW